MSGPRRQTCSGCVLLTLVSVVTGGLAGCGEHRDPHVAAAHYHPPAYRPEDFPDIPLYPLAGYELDPNADQLAVSLAGGTVRRFEVSMVTRPGERDDPPVSVLQRYDVDLAAFGWIKDGSDHWRKGLERLFIETGRSGRLTTVRFHLRPADAEAAPRS